MGRFNELFAQGSRGFVNVDATAAGVTITNRRPLVDIADLHYGHQMCDVQIGPRTINDVYLHHNGNDRDYEPQHAILKFRVGQLAPLPDGQQMVFEQHANVPIGLNASNPGRYPGVVLPPRPRRDGLKIASLEGRRTRFEHPDHNSVTVECYAGDTDHLFTTYAGSGSHTGTPSNGNDVQVWQDEATPSTRNMAFIYPSVSTNVPHFASPGSMQLPSLSFNGSSDYYGLYDNTGSTSRALSTAVTNSAYTNLQAIYPTGVTGNPAAVYDAIASWADSLGFAGTHFRSISSVNYIYAYNWDGSEDVTIGLAVNTSTSYVIQQRHGSGVLRLYVISGAGGATVANSDVASGNTSDLTGQVLCGRNYTTAYYNGAMGHILFDNADLGETNSQRTNFVSLWLPAASGGIVSSKLVGKQARLAGRGGLAA